MIYKIVADSVVFLHLLWILFLVFGAFFGRKNNMVKIFHLSGLLFALLIQIIGGYCPLTHLEVWLRSKHMPDLVYTGSFIIHYIEKIVYIELSRFMILLLTLFLIGLNAWVYLASIFSSKGEEGEPG